MKKLTILSLCLILSGMMLMMFACAKQEDSSTETQDSSDSGNSGDSSDEVITEKVNGYIQKGPFVQGTEVTMRTLRYDLAPTGKTYTGTIEDNSRSFLSEVLSEIDMLNFQQVVIFSMR